MGFGHTDMHHLVCPVQSSRNSEGVRAGFRRIVARTKRVMRCCARIDRWRRRDVQSAGRGQEEKVIANIGRNRHQAQPPFAQSLSSPSAVSHRLGHSVNNKHVLFPRGLRVADCQPRQPLKLLTLIECVSLTSREKPRIFVAYDLSAEPCSDLLSRDHHASTMSSSRHGRS